MKSIHYEPLNFPPSDYHIFTDCRGMGCLGVFISKHIDSPLKGLDKRH